MQTDNTFHQPKTHWPTNKVMEQIYVKNLWGSNDTDFYSGEGSHNIEVTQPYLQAVTEFLTSFENPLSVIDLGCGDFNVGKELVQHTKKYVAIDVVENLIIRNKEKYAADNLSFQCLDIATDEWPTADCIVLRQVLQHLSNAEVQKIVSKLANYKYVILTEHLPLGEFTPNVDILTGQGIRLKKQSGIQLTKPPFNFNCIEEQELVNTVLEKGKGCLVTTLYFLV